MYNIKVKNISKNNNGVSCMRLNGEIIESQKIHLNMEGGIYTIEVES